MIRVLFVCLGNICRSPLAEGIFKELVKEQNLEKYFTTDSAGTAAYHIGDLPDIRSRKVAEENGFELQHYGRQITVEDFTTFDYIIPMDKSNLNNVLSLQKKVGNLDVNPEIKLMLSYDSDAKESEVPDPYYGGKEGFQKVYQMLLSANKQLLEQLKDKYLPTTS